MAAPVFSGTTYTVTSVYAVSANEVWATIDGGTWPIQWNGTKWDFYTAINLSVEGAFHAITGIGSNHLFIAGSHGQIIHRSTNTWKLERKTETGGFSSDILVSLWAYDLNTFYAGGTWGQVLKRNADGTWSQVLGGGLFGGLGMVAIWGRSPADVFVQGPQTIRHITSDGVTTNDYALKMRGQWFAGAGAGDRLYGVGSQGVTHEFLPDAPGDGVLSPLAAGGESRIEFTLKGATPCGPSGVLLYGSSQYGPAINPLFQFDGELLKPVATVPPGLTPDCTIGAAIATGSNDIVVAWLNKLTSVRGVHRWDGQQWNGLGSGLDIPFNAIAFWRSPTGKLFACRPSQVQVLNAQNEWIASYDVPADQTASTVLTAIWGRTDQEVYIASLDGRILRFDGTLWKEETTPVKSAIRALGGTATDLYAAGDNGLLWRRTASGWQKVPGVPARDGDNFTALVPKGTNVFAAQQTPGQYTGGGLGLIWKLNGSTASLVVKGLSQPFTAFTADGEGYLYGFAPNSFILTDKPATQVPTMTRLDLAATDWRDVGSSGVQVRPVAPQPGSPVVAVQRFATPSATQDAPAPTNARWAGEHWIIRQDVFPGGAAVPPMQVRFQYNPALLPLDFDPATATLYRYAAGNWTAVPAEIDPVGHWIRATEPTGLSEWTFGFKLLPALPRLRVARADPAGVLIAWPTNYSGFRVQISASLPGSANWQPLDNQPVEKDGYFEVLQPADDLSRFYRLAK